MTDRTVRFVGWIFLASVFVASMAYSDSNRGTIIVKDCRP